MATFATRQRASTGKSKPSGCNRKTVRHPPTNESLGHSKRTNLEHPLQSNLALKLRGMSQPSSFAAVACTTLKSWIGHGSLFDPCATGSCLLQKAFGAQIKVAGAAAPHELLLREGDLAAGARPARLVGPEANQRVTHRALFSVIQHIKQSLSILFRHSAAARLPVTTSSSPSSWRWLGRCRPA